MRHSGEISLAQCGVHCTIQRRVPSEREPILASGSLQGQVNFEIAQTKPNRKCGRLNACRDLIRKILTER